MSCKVLEQSDTGNGVGQGADFVIRVRHAAGLMWRHDERILHVHDGDGVFQHRLYAGAGRCGFFTALFYSGFRGGFRHRFVV
ncbi:hypothetical protein [Pantoea dispersa]|uniref:hypothetical protein n=1 Tax=Pantoea dispersa TaxID=59814 RepID=UPI0021ADC044|nr:hypothetical protein [Pantoea dispersa]